MKKFLTLTSCVLILLITSPSSFSQRIQWNHAPQKGYVYQITNREAQKLLAVSRAQQISDKLLYNRIDTFDVSTGWINRPDKGHFIQVMIIGNKLHCNYTCVFPYQVFLLKEYNALALQVLDKEGNVRKDAKVKLGLINRIRIDTATNSYRIENIAFNREYQIATVELDGFRSVFNIQKHDVPEWYGNNYDEDSGPDFYSYMITDKNKYKPGEKVRFKSYALSQFRSPIKRDLEVWLSAYPKEYHMGNISPHRPGSFAGDFFLHDSLKLRLDQQYYLQLRDHHKRIVASCNFSYEDYELTGNKLDLQLSKSHQFFPDTNTLSITATDENGLMLKDARAEIVIKNNTIQESFQPLAMLPDTLKVIRTELDPDKPTLIQIPPGLFDKTNTSYSVRVSVRNSENQLLENARNAWFYYSNYELVSHFKDDSICFDLLRNNIPQENVQVSKRLDDEINWTEVTFPYIEKLNPAVREYHFQNQLIQKDILVNQLNPRLEISGGIQRDSFNISLHNPQKLHVSWFVYQGGQLLHRGSGTEMELKSVITDRSQTYYVELLYAFGGTEQIRQRVFEFREDFLDISLDIPERIYPGQKVEATIAVRDQKGYPVKGADLTAMAVTSKLDYYVPSLPYYGPGSSPRSMAVHYSKTGLDRYHTELKLDYSKWKKQAQLDTMMYYQFTYPEQSGFIFKMPITDSTQFAPYIMKDGVAQTVYVIEADHKPVYYSWTAQPSAYSFYVSPGRNHEITLRLWDRVVILDSMKFDKGMKTIISINLENPPAGTRITKLENHFSLTEINRIRPFVSSFSAPAGMFSYLDNDLNNDFVPIYGSSDRQNYGNIVVGPLPEGKKTYVESYVIRTTYRHAGGFNYSFEDNIVYKTNPANLWPNLLTVQDYNPMENVNNLKMTKSHFMALQNAEKPKRKWQARTIDMADSDGRMRIFLPDVKEEGIAAVIFSNTTTKKIISPFFDRNTTYTSVYNTFPLGSQSLIVLYTDGRYLKMDNIPMKLHHHYVVDLNNAEWHPADSLSAVWLHLYEWNPERYFQNSAPVQKPDRIYQFSANETGNLTGSIYDENNDPLPGAVVIIKGTRNGAVTDINGHFVLQLDEYSAIITVSFVGFVTEEFTVTRGSEIRLKLQPDIQALDEVVVVGYGTTMKSDLTTSLQGKMAGISVSPEENLPGIPDDVQITEDTQAAEKQLYQELMSLKTIRSNFSDVGFWEPRLYTDHHGLSKFTVTFPDDITRWDAVVYAMNRGLQTGTLRKSIRSYKPLMTELNVPGFLTLGDSSFFSGKVLNYSGDTLIHGKTEWSGAGADFSKEIAFNHYHADLLPVNVNSTDSLTTRYIFTRDDGYLDGEERTIKVIEQGTIRAEGSLSILNNGDVKNASASAGEKTFVEILDNQLDVYKGSATSLIHYRYLCNEQLASRLIGFINYKLMMQFEGKPFRYEKDVKHIIAKLLRNQNSEFLWSWWDISGKTSYWMSAHILRALRCAKDAGYEVNLNIDNLARKAEYKFEFLNQYSLSDISLLQSLAQWGAELKYGKYIQILDSLVTFDERQSRYSNYPVSFLTEKFTLQEIRQITNLGYQRDSILHYRQEGMLGDLHFSDGKAARYWYTDEMSANTIAYRIMKRDSLLKGYLTAMQLYFMTTQPNGGWNTYQSSNLLMVVLPDLLSEGATREHPAKIILSGKENNLMTTFPYRIELLPGEELRIQKESGAPLYFMQYTEERVKEAGSGVEGFKIKTWFTGNKSVLEAGKPVDLIVDVSVEKKSAAEHVMIEIPIPGSCSYADKRHDDSGVETHREYFKEKTVIFCEQMVPGKYTFKITLLPRFTGRYFVNPAKVSLMYFPVVNANTDLKTVLVK